MRLPSLKTTKFGLGMSKFGWGRGRGSRRKTRTSNSRLQGERLEERTAFSAGGLAMGLNLASANASNREWVFVDVFKQHSPWSPQKTNENGIWNTGQPLALTDDGYPLLAPGQAAGTLMLRDSQGTHPAGTYTVTWQGTGRIAFGMDARVSNSEDHRVELEVTPSRAGIYLRIDESARQDPIRDIKVWMPGFENAANPFHPTFLERLDGVRVLRFMDWGRTNGSGLIQWQDRTTPGDANQGSGEGVAIEIMIDLANALDIEPWFNIPHLADDQFIRQHARLALNRLEPGRKVYVEFSNEVWNHGPGFGQGDWALTEAARTGLSVPEIVAQHSRRVFEIWQQVWGSQAGRIVRVAPAWTANPHYTAAMCEALGGDFDVLSATAYFSTKGYPLDRQASPEQVLLAAQDAVETRSLPQLARQKAIADEWSTRLGREIPLVLYEGGQHLVATDPEGPTRATLRQAQTNPLMYQVYQSLFEGLDALDVDLFVGYSYVDAGNKNGTWGHLEYQTQPTSEAPKWQAFQDAMHGRFASIDSLPPSAQLLARNNFLPDELWFTVRYTDDVAIDLTDLDTSDITVTSPSGVRLIADHRQVSAVDGYRGVRVMYRFVLPGHRLLMPGAYRVQARASAVTDTSGNVLAAGQLGSIVV